MHITIYHNPACGTSRNTLALIRNTGVKPTVVNYLTEPPSRDQLQHLIRAAGLTVRQALRENGTPFTELGLDDLTLTDDALLDAMLSHPILINRPFVQTPIGVRLCRPSETVLAILPLPQRGALNKEDGAAIIGADGRLVSATHTLTDLPNLLAAHVVTPQIGALTPAPHAPRILLLYGSLRERSYSKLLTLEAERLLQHFGAETRVFDPHGLPMVDSVTPDHPKVQELRALSLWSEGQVWCSPERHGTMTAIFKSQIDWLPLELGATRPTQGRTLAVMQVSGGSQSFNAVNALRILGRWMRMVTIPNQSSVAKAYEEFADDGRMKPSPYYDRLTDVMEELVKFTLLVRDRAEYLTSRYSERKAQGQEGLGQVAQPQAAQTQEAQSQEAARLAQAAMAHETATQQSIAPDGGAAS